MIGEKIKQSLEELEMSQMQLAIKTGYTSRSSINKIELGVNDVPRKKLSLFAEALKVNIDYLLEIDIPMDIEDNIFKIKLKELREKKDISQYQLAADLHLSQSTIGNWEAGKREPNFKTLKCIADYFDVSIDYLLGRDSKIMTKNEMQQRFNYELSEKFAHEYANLLEDKHFIDTVKLYNAINSNLRAMCLSYIAAILGNIGVDTNKILGY